MSLGKYRLSRGHPNIPCRASYVRLVLYGDAVWKDAESAWNDAGAVWNDAESAWNDGAALF